MNHMFLATWSEIVWFLLCWLETREPLGCGPPHRGTCLPKFGQASPAADGTPTHLAPTVRKECVCGAHGTLSQGHGSILGHSSQDEHRRPLPENATSRSSEITLSNCTARLQGPDPWDRPGHVKPVISIHSKRPIRWSKKIWHEDWPEL